MSVSVSVTMCVCMCVCVCSWSVCVCGGGGGGGYHTIVNLSIKNGLTAGHMKPHRKCTVHDFVSFQNHQNNDSLTTEHWH